MTNGRILILPLLTCAAHGAGKKEKVAYPPLPETLAAAHSVFIVNQTPEDTDHAIKKLAEWGRYKTSPKSEADLLFRFSLFNFRSIRSLRKIDPAIDMPAWNGCCIPEAPYARLAVYDLHT